MQEPDMTLDQMLDDPIVRQLMARDGVVEADLRALAARVRPRDVSLASPSRLEPEPRSFGPDQA
jgi:hypothetical protein